MLLLIYYEKILYKNLNLTQLYKPTYSIILQIDIIKKNLTYTIVTATALKIILILALCVLLI